MRLKEKRLLAGIAALILCAAVTFPALGEVHSVNTEEKGRITETVWVDDQDQAVTGPEGYASVRYSYKKDETTERYYDTDGRPCKAAGGYYGRTVTRDAKGQIIQIEYLDENGQRTLNNMGYAMVAISYYGFGEVRSATYYGLNKKPVMVPSLGYASVYNEYSNKTMVSRTFRDAKGNPVDCSEGYAAVRQKVNKSYQVIRIRYEHADGSPATGPDGWYRCVKDRDDQGRVTSVKYYDIHENLIDRGAGYAWEEFSYEGDNLVRVTRYSLSGEKVEDSAGVATLVREMKDGRIVKERFLDKEGKRINNDLGVGEILYSYDHLDRIEKVSYLDTEGNPVLCRKGYAGYRDMKDEDGMTVSRTFLGTDGLAAEIPGGYSEIRYLYDETGKLTSTRYYDLNGTQVQAE